MSSNVGTTASEHAENHQHPSHRAEHEATARRAIDKRLLVLPFVLVGVIALMLLAFAAPALKSGAHDLPLAVGGPAQATSQLIKALDDKAPGTFEISEHTDPEDARQAVLDRDAVGAISVGQQGVTVVTASGAGAPYGPILKSIGASMQAQGMPVAYDDVAPFPADDKAGVALTSLGLPLAFGGMVSGIVLLQLTRGHVIGRLLASAAVGVLGGLVAASILQYGFHALDGDFLLTVAGVALGIIAIAWTILGLHALIGPPGIGIGAVLIMFISNPISGLAAGPHWLPSPWGAIGQHMPIGAAGTVLRSAAYFDGRGSTSALITLGCWIAGGALLAALGTLRSRRTAATGSAHPGPRGADQTAHADAELRPAQA